MNNELITVLLFGAGGLLMVAVTYLIAKKVYASYDVAKDVAGSAPKEDLAPVSGVGGTGFVLGHQVDTVGRFPVPESTTEAVDLDIFIEVPTEEIQVPAPAKVKKASKKKAAKRKGKK